MRFKTILRYEGTILLFLAVLAVFPIIVGLCFGEYSHLLPFAFAALIYAALGGASTFFTRGEKRKLGAKEGLAIVGLSWILASAIGALPFVIDGCIPAYIDALFEISSGFTTTGASILSNVEALPKCMLFWRSFSHWIGGMGILVFILAVMPNTDGSAFNLLKFESPGPQVGKLVGKVRLTAAILYAIYIAMTILELVLLLFGGIGFFDSLLISLSTAGTGGFTHTAFSIGQYGNLYVEIVTMIFMFLFGMNFNIYYLLLLKNFKNVLLDEELRAYVIYLIVFILLIAANTAGIYGNFITALRYSSFTVISEATSTGFAVADYTAWPEFSKTLLMIGMFIGACAGGTGGGFKVSRVVILVKSAYAHLCEVLRPHSVQVVKFNGKLLGESDISGVERYFFIYCAIFASAVIVLSLNGFDFLTNFSAALACINNDGPGMTSIIGPYGSYACFPWWSKIVCICLMFIGRLEIFPIILLFLPKMWKRCA